jgi:hypothetical protein
VAAQIGRVHCMHLKHCKPVNATTKCFVGFGAYNAPYTVISLCKLPLPRKDIKSALYAPFCDTNGCCDNAPSHFLTNAADIIDQLLNSLPFIIFMVNNLVLNGLYNRHCVESVLLLEVVKSPLLRESG